jgi:hypothetical protein
MTLIDRVLNVPLRLAIALRSGQFLRSETRPEHLIDLAWGSESLRVLVVGAGLAAGYGARTQAGALPGQLAMALSSRSGRGVTVQTKAQPFLPLADTIELLEPDGGRRYDLVVFAPGFTEMTRATTTAWRRQLFELVLFLNRTVPDSSRIVLTGLPLPKKRGVLEWIGRRGVHAANAVLADVAFTVPRAVYVPTPPFETLKPSGGSFDERYYVRCAESIVDAVLPQLVLG